jgi:hypothetical protein
MLLFTRSMRAKQLVPGATDEGRERLDAALVLKVPALGNDVLIALAEAGFPNRSGLPLKIGKEPPSLTVGCTANQRSCLVQGRQ